jgi:voltage-gated potassium channel
MEAPAHSADPSAGRTTARRPSSRTSRLHRTFAWSAAALAIVVLGGTVGFHALARREQSWVDCLYMTFITITTIGFGEIVDLAGNPAGRLFTIFLALCGIGVITYTLSSLTAFIVEGDLNQVFARRRMQKTIESLRDHFIVCGIEGVGRYIVAELHETHRPAVVVDFDGKHVEKALETFADRLYVEGDATDSDVLRQAGILRAEGLFAVAGDDNHNLVVSLTAKQLNPAIKVVSCCHDLKNVDKMKKAGADAVVSPAFIGGLRMASEMIRPAVVSFLDIMLRDKKINLRIEEIPVPDSVVGRPLSILNLQRHPDTLLLAMRTKDEWAFNPPRQQTFAANTTLILMTTPEDRLAIERQLA